MTEERRDVLTIGLWFLSAIVLVALFISAGLQGELTAAHLAFASVMLLLATVGTVTLWRMKDSVTQYEKSKRHEHDAYFHDSHADEHTGLDHHLIEENADHESMSTYLDDDGEIRQQR